ncbi:hypothetical protein NDA16_003077 [Ustilago loliicola]|nr:hypothetical protein NDA16_003077 [Ustilago loliicola]
MTSTYLAPNSVVATYNGTSSTAAPHSSDEPLFAPISNSSNPNPSRVCYFFDSDIGNYHYGPGHPMKPTRIRMCHSLVMNYGLYKRMEIFRAKPATKREMSQFHTDEYVEFLNRVTPDNVDSFVREQAKFNVGDDCELRDIGIGKGKMYSCNFPLRDGIIDESYKTVFEPVISQIMQHYQPSAVVLQCGSDSLAGDKLGCFNLSMRGHANCVEFVKSFGLPLLLLGGGGYTMRNVSRAWAFETGLAAGQELNPQIPVNEYYEYFGPDYRLDVRPNNMEDLNTREYLEKIKIQVFENLRQTAHAPSVQGHVEPRSIAEQLHLQNLANAEEGEDEEMDLADKGGLQALEDRHPDERVVGLQAFRDYTPTTASATTAGVEAFTAAANSTSTPTAQEAPPTTTTTTAASAQAEAEPATTTADAAQKTPDAAETNMDLD